MAEFTHLEPGTAEAVWRSDGRLAELPELDLGVERLIVIASHPDDETLGAAGLMSRVHRDGGRVTVVVATDGEASHPDSPTHSRAQLAMIRREEVRRAVRIVAPSADVHFLQLPDSGLRERRAALQSGLREILRPDGPRGAWRGFRNTCRRPVVRRWAPRPPHHRRGRRRTVRRARHPPSRVPDLAVALGGACAGAVELEPGAHPERGRTIAKDRALAQHRTQVHPLSPHPGDEPVLHTAMQEHFVRPREVFVAGERCDGHACPREHFDAFYDRHEDPWGFESRWYEQRKRDVLMASLPHRRLGRVLEIGCATGLLTAELTLRADT